MTAFFGALMHSMWLMQDTLDAWHAMGGNLDRTGKIAVDKLRQICEVSGVQG
jgi:hypothetical protein